MTLRQPKGHLIVGFGQAGDELWNVYLVRVDDDGDWLDFSLEVYVREDREQAQICANEISTFFGIDVVEEKK